MKGKARERRARLTSIHGSGVSGNRLWEEIWQMFGLVGARVSVALCSVFCFAFTSLHRYILGGVYVSICVLL